MTNIMKRLPDVTDVQRARIMAAPRNAAAHSDLMQTIDAMTALEVGGKGSVPQLPLEFGIAAWNVERCLFPQDSAALLGAYGLDIVLLSEMDSGMARTGQRNTTAEMAACLNMHYAYGVEFYEMELGGPTERHYCKDDFNQSGWHGNAILSSAPFEKLALIRLDQKGHWFSACADGAADPEQPRVGGRMAVAAVVLTQGGPVCVVSTHLESNADADYRHLQFARLLYELDALAPDMPILIGGDLNTGNHLPPDFDWRKENLFELARGQGYDWSLTPDGVTTRASLITPHQTRKMKLDWFCHRGLVGHGETLVAALDKNDRPLSDHEIIAARVSIA